MSTISNIAHIDGKIIRRGPEAVSGADHNVPKNTHALPQLTPGMTYNVSTSWSRRGATGGKPVCIGNCVVSLDGGEHLPEMYCNKLPQEPDTMPGSWKSSFTASQAQENLVVDLFVTVGDWIEIDYSVDISIDVPPPSPANFAGDANQNKGSFEDGWWAPHDKEPDYVQTIDDLIAGVTYQVQLKVLYKGGKYNGVPGGPDFMGNGEGFYMASLDIHIDDTAVMSSVSFMGAPPGPTANKGDRDLGVSKFVARGTQAKLVVSNACSNGWFYAHVEGVIKAV